MIYSDDKEILAAACWYAQDLGIADADFTLEIIMYDEAEDFSGSGWIDYGNKVATINISNNLTPQEDRMEILAHEMIHLKQYVTGQLKDVPVLPLAIWEGKFYPVSNDPASTAYWDSPWELEAFGRQQGLNYRRQLAK